MGPKIRNNKFKRVKLGQVISFDFNFNHVYSVDLQGNVEQVNAF